MEDSIILHEIDMKKANESTFIKKTVHLLQKLLANGAAIGGTETIRILRGHMNIIMVFSLNPVIRQDFRLK